MPGSVPFRQVCSPVQDSVLVLMCQTSMCDFTKGLNSSVPNAVCYKTGQLYAKAAYLDTQSFRMLQSTVQVLRALSSEHYWNYVDMGKSN